MKFVKNSSRNRKKKHKILFYFLIKFIQKLIQNFVSVSFAGLSRAQRQLSKSLAEFNFECIGSTQTDDEQVIVDSLKQFSKLIANIEDERDNMVGSLVLSSFEPKEVLMLVVFIHFSSQILNLH